MIVVFEKEYLQELYSKGSATSSKYRFQPHIVAKFIKVINLMKQLEDVTGLMKFGSLRYEKLHGDKEGLSSVRVNDRYRIEFVESMESGKQVATICSIMELSNHYQ
ncbi:MAG: type II toxin-antitoxin system RelE/ParE family toxin [Bacteroidales bacterium]|nr:type II toxin-antitoxin system RelE/ParE family toxin [Bacteroidales bacterium]